MLAFVLSFQINRTPVHVLFYFVILDVFHNTLSSVLFLAHSRRQNANKDLLQKSENRKEEEEEEREEAMQYSKPDPEI